MKIHAAHRLKANANEAQARKYIKHVTGVKPLEKWEDTNDIISFYVDPLKANAIKSKLDAQFTPIPRGMHSSATSHSYYIDDSKTRIITVISLIGYGGLKTLVSLTDKNHEESIIERYKRMQAEKEQK